jgi:sulfonate transport system substrate-binding protein
MNRRHALSSTLALALMAFAPVSMADQPSTVRIAYQKSSTLIALLRANGALEKDLAAIGVTVKWSEFTSGLPLLEALNVGAVDLGGDVADSVPVFAQAAGAKFTYVAAESPSPAAQAILVKPDSALHSFADLKGKKIAVAKASGSHYLLLAALAKANLSLKDIQPAFLSPADGRAAFEKGAVDAWVVWDPYVAAAEKQSNVRILASGKDIATYQRYYLAATSFAAARPDVVKIVFAKLKETGEWAKKNPDEAARILAPVWGLDESVVLRANDRRTYAVHAVTLENLADTQKIADAFYAERALPKTVTTRDAPIWSPDKQASTQ